MADDQERTLGELLDGLFADMLAYSAIEQMSPAEVEQKLSEHKRRKMVAFARRGVAAGWCLRSCGVP